MRNPIDLVRRAVDGVLIGSHAQIGFLLLSLWRASMAKALLGHVGGSDLLLQSEVRRLRARVRDLQAEVDRLRMANAELQAAVSMHDELIRISVSDAEPALT